MLYKKKSKLRNEENVIIQNNLYIADTFFTRLIGLLGKAELTAEESLLIYPCKEVHTYGMKYSIQVFILNKDGECIEHIPELKPNKRSGYYRNGYCVLETNVNNTKLKLCKKFKWD